MSSLAGVKIYIYEDTFWNGEPVWGELHVLEDTADTLHYAGSKSHYRTITFWVLDPDDWNTIEGPYKTGTSVSFTGWLAGTYTVKIRELSVVRILTDISRPPDYAVLQCRAKLMDVT